MNNNPRSVKEAAALLDNNMPGWERRINIENLCMEYTNGRCVLQQLFNGDYTYGLTYLRIGVFSDSLERYPIWNKNVYLDDWKAEINVRLNKEVMPVVIYRVEATAVDRNYTLAYATGNVEDIKNYFKDRGGYGLELKLVTPIHITKEMGEEKASLLKEKERIDLRLKEIESLLNSPKYRPTI